MRLAVAVILVSLLAGCLDTSGGADNLSPSPLPAQDSGEATRMFHLHDEQLAVFVNVTERAGNVTLTWSGDDEPMREGRIRTWLSHHTPAKSPIEFLWTAYSASAPALVSVTAGGQDMSVGNRPELSNPTGEVERPDPRTWPLSAGPNVLLLITNGTSARLSLALDPPELWSRAEILPVQDVVRFYSNLGGTSFDNHTEVQFGVNGVVQAELVVPVRHEMASVYASTRGSRGSLEIETPSGVVCDDTWRFMGPYPMTASVHYGGVGDHRVTTTSLLAGSVTPNSFEVLVVDLPYWPAPDDPVCLG